MPAHLLVLLTVSAVSRLGLARPCCRWPLLFKKGWTSLNLTFDSTQVLELPLTRQQLGFQEQGDRGNAVLLLAEEMQPAKRALYQQAGYVHEGVCISSCDPSIFALLEEMQLRWCPWPDRGFTLAVCAHERIGVLADQLVVQRLIAASVDGDQPS